MLPRFTVISILIVAAVVAGCRTVPVTGRRQVLLMPEKQEIALGEQSYAEILKDEQETSNAEWQAMVERVGRRIAEVADRPDYAWEFRVIEGQEMNAFALPGGKVAVYEGILPVCQSEAGLAVVMSHEIAHALARHGGERMSQQRVTAGLGAAVNWSTGNLDEKKRAMIDGAFGVASKYGVTLPYSRKHESEADAIGLKLMAQAGYDPSEAPLFWERFSGVGGAKPPEFLSTHPSDTRRASDLREQLPEALALYRDAGTQHGLGEPVPAIQTASFETPATQ